MENTRPWRLAAVSYINTLPFLQGIASTPEMADKLVIHKVAPVECARLFARREVEIALVPVGTLPLLTGYQRITPYGIGSRGPVETVVVCSERPITELQHITLDPDSRSSSGLLRILLKHYWLLDVKLTVGDVNLPPSASTTGRLLIGDKVRSLTPGMSYVYDLGELWTAWTGLPMIYAVWIARQDIAASAAAMLTPAFHHGLQHIDEIAIEDVDEMGYWRRYLDEVICYDVDASGEQAIDHYLRLKSATDGESDQTI